MINIQRYVYTAMHLAVEECWHNFWKYIQLLVELLVIRQPRRKSAPNCLKQYKHRTPLRDYPIMPCHTGAFLIGRQSNFRIRLTLIFQRRVISDVAVAVPRHKMAAVSQTTLSNAFSLMKKLAFRLRFHWSLFLSVQLTIFQHWFS